MVIFLYYNITGADLLLLNTYCFIRKVILLFSINFVCPHISMYIIWPNRRYLMNNMVAHGDNRTENKIENNIMHLEKETIKTIHNNTAIRVTTNMNSLRKTA